MSSTPRPLPGASAETASDAPAYAAQRGSDDHGPRLRAPSPRVVLALGAAAVLGVLLYLGREALTPFLLGLLLIYLLHPPVRWLARHGVPRTLAVLLVYVGAAFLLIEAVALLTRPLVEQVATFAQELPRFGEALDRLVRQVSEAYSRLELPAPVRSAVDRAVAQGAQGASGFDATGVLFPIARTVAGTVGAVFGFLIVPVWAFYILKDREKLASRFEHAVPAAWRRDTFAVIGIVERIFGRWLRGQLLLGLIVGAATFAGLLLLGQFIDPRFLQCPL